MRREAILCIRSKCNFLLFIPEIGKISLFPKFTDLKSVESMFRLWAVGKQPEYGRTAPAHKRAECPRFKKFSFDCGNLRMQRDGYGF